jgi:serine protease AprX
VTQLPSNSGRALLAAFLVATSLAAPASASPAEADQDAPWWETTLLDGDDDGVDDSLERQVEGAAPGESVRALVAYGEPPTEAEIDALRDRDAEVLHVAETVPTVVVRVPADRVDDLADAPGVVLVEKDRLVEPLLDESRPLVGGVGMAEARGYGGSGVSVAVFDTGIDVDHPDLEDKLRASYDATEDDSVAGGFLGGADDPAEPGDTDGHGTHVAGTAAGTGQSSGYQYVGLAPDADLVAVDIFDDQGRARSSYILKGIDWILDNQGRYGIKIMQMSIGGEPTDGKDSVSRAIGVGAEEGVLSVVAAGNQGPDQETITFPGVAPAALTVGAVDDDKRVAEFSSRGPSIAGDKKPDIVAPGVDIMSTLPPEVNGGSNYGELSGTSMAAPHAAGVAAATWQANASLSPTLVKWILVAGSAPIGPDSDSWHPGLGWGFLDAEIAVQAARNPAVLGQTPYDERIENLEFGSAAGQLDRLLFQADQTRRSLIPTTSFAALAGLAAAAFGRRRW